MEMPILIWSVLYYLGCFVGLYVLAIIGFLLFARLEKDQDGSLLINPKSLHYRVCNKFYRWGTCHVEVYKIGLCGYFWRVFWAFILLPISRTILAVWQTLKTVIYAPFMFLFGYYPWPTIESMRNYNGEMSNIFAIEVRRISFPRVGKFELKPYLVLFPPLYGWLFWSYPYMIGKWSAACLAIVLVIGVLYIIIAVADRVKKSKEQSVILMREYITAIWRGVCPLLKVKL